MRELLEVSVSFTSKSNRILAFPILSFNESYIPSPLSGQTSNTGGFRKSRFARRSSGKKSRIHSAS